MFNKIEQLQSYIINLIHEYSDKSLSSLTKDNCSELSRLAGAWLINEFPKDKVYILKGAGLIFGQQRSHDIIALVQSNNVLLIDPSIWQLKPNTQSILINEANSLTNALTVALNYYGGKWVISEELKNIQATEIEKWKNIVRENILEIDK